MFTEKLKAKIEEIYAERSSQNPALFREIDMKIKSCTPDIQILLRYLYGNMPVSDVVNYSFDTYLDYAGHGAFLWENGPFKDRISEEIFCQYVVYHRINTEDISPCRSFFYGKVKDEICGHDTMQEAVLALNYWCAGEVTYRASDDRTASPMTAYRSAHGRCGEESTFTVSVLRSMGIPARQVYAPRWSHCDDNHAWVEAWCDGTWHFLGACEPEEVLDKGWFLHASSRAMLIHSRWYGSLALAGDAVKEDNLVSTQGMTTELNEISTYANTKRVKITVRDADGQPVPGAAVSIEVLNYSEFFPVAVMQTDKDGAAEIELGLGSCRISVKKENTECSRIIDVKECTAAELVLSRDSGKAGTHGNDGATLSKDACTMFECFAPQDAVIHSGFVTEEQKKRQKEKLAKRTADRLKKTGTGNEAEVEAFLCKTEHSGYRKLLLNTLSDKDSLDLKAEVLEAHLQHAVQYADMYPSDIFVKYVLSPRIFTEILTAFRQGIDAMLTEDRKRVFRKSPDLVWDFIRESIKERPEEEYDALLTLPVPCLRYGIGSRQSQEILFVAVCRTLGIPSRLNPVDRTMEYYQNGRFVQVTEPEAAGKLCIYGDPSQNFVYFQNWSVTRKHPGERKLLDFSDIRVDERAEVSLPSGVYEVITANRLPNGNILGRAEEVKVEPGRTVFVELKLIEAELDQMLECVPMPPFEVEDLNGVRTGITDALKGSPNLVVWLAEGQEPTEHILNELCERAEEFNREEAGILFLVDSGAALKQPTLHKTMQLLKHIRVLCDCVEERVSVLGRRFYVDPESIPLILVTDKETNCVYAASGYNVGTADMILKIMDAGIL